MQIEKTVSAPEGNLFNTFSTIEISPARSSKEFFGQGR